MQPILSVIIPTHNRFELASLTIKTIISNFPKTEIVVSETSTEPKIKSEFSKEISEGIIKYIRPAVGIDIVSNFEIAFQQATGKYVTFIGDDDCVGPHIEDVVGWAIKNHIDALTGTLPVNYYWPDFITKMSGNKYSASLSIKPFTGSAKKLKSDLALKRALDNLGGGLDTMPRGYHGIVSRDLCTTIINKYGSLFGGVSPDIYIAALISKEATNAYIVDYPITLPGSSGVSGAGQSAKGKHIGFLRDTPYMAAFKNLEWDVIIPEFYSVETVWGYSLVKAIDAINIYDNTHIPNIERLIVKCLFYHSDYRKFVYKAYKNYRMTHSFPKVLCRLTMSFFKETVNLAMKIVDKLLQLFIPSKSIHIKQQDTIDKAFNSLCSFVKEHPNQLFFRLESGDRLDK